MLHRLYSKLLKGGSTREINIQGSAIGVVEGEEFRL